MWRAATDRAQSCTSRRPVATMAPKEGCANRAFHCSSTLSSIFSSTRLIPEVATNYRVVQNKFVKRKATLLLYSSGDAIITSSMTLDAQSRPQAALRREKLTERHN